MQPAERKSGEEEEEEEGEIPDRVKVRERNDRPNQWQREKEREKERGMIVFGRRIAQSISHLNTKWEPKTLLVQSKDITREMLFVFEP